MVAKLRGKSRAQLLAQTNNVTPGRPVNRDSTVNELLIALLEGTPVADANDTITVSDNGYVEKIVDTLPTDADRLAAINGLDAYLATLGAYSADHIPLLQNYILTNILGGIGGNAVSFGAKADGTYQIRIEGDDISIGWVFSS